MYSCFACPPRAHCIASKVCLPREVRTHTARAAHVVRVSCARVQSHALQCLHAARRLHDGVEVPMLPERAVDRPELIAALKQRVLEAEQGSHWSSSATAVTAPARKTNATVANGMGGVGKTMTAAALVREEDVRSAFDSICWATLLEKARASQLATRVSSPRHWLRATTFWFLSFVFGPENVNV